MTMFKRVAVNVRGKKKAFRHMQSVNNNIRFQLLVQVLG